MLLTFLKLHLSLRRAEKIGWFRSEEKGSITVLSFSFCLGHAGGMVIAEIAGYGLVFLVGSVVGAIGMRFGSLALRQQKREQIALKKSQYELAQCYHGLVEHSAGYLALLKKMAHEGHTFHQHLVMTMQELMPENIKNNLLDSTFDTIDGDPMLIKEGPCDYASHHSGLLQSRKQNKS